MSDADLAWEALLRWFPFAALDFGPGGAGNDPDLARSAMTVAREAFFDPIVRPFLFDLPLNPVTGSRISMVIEEWLLSGARSGSEAVKIEVVEQMYGQSLLGRFEPFAGTELRAHLAEIGLDFSSR